MNIPSDSRYTKDHEWLKPIAPTRFQVGITDYAQTELGDVVFVDLPAVGASFEAGASMASVESVKAVSDIYAPVAGTIAEVNAALVDAPETINSDPFGAGWMVVIESSSDLNTLDLMSAAEYSAYLAELSK